MHPALSRQGFGRQIQQRGATLFVALVFLVLLTIVGISMFQTSSIEERMTRNFNEYNVAFQAAEAGLRDAELRISGEWVYGRSITNKTTLPLNPVAFTLNCTNGLCGKDNTQDIVADFDLLTATDSTSSAVSVKLGACPPASSGGCDGNGEPGIINGSCSLGTCSPPIANVEDQPRYMMQLLATEVPGSNPDGDLSVVRVVAVGYGRSRDARVILQSVYFAY
jgi:Tfp pilus assembly protein PilX